MTERPHLEPPRPLPPARPLLLLAVAVGGIGGAAARYGLARSWPASPGELPWATLAANVAGSLLLGFVLVVVAERRRHRNYVRELLASGVLGAFTTMSTFQVESVLLVDGGHAGVALGYAALSLGAGLAAAATGIGLGRRVPLHPHRVHEAERRGAEATP